MFVLRGPRTFSLVTFTLISNHVGNVSQPVTGSFAGTQVWRKVAIFEGPLACWCRGNAFGGSVAQNGDRAQIQVTYALPQPVEEEVMETPDSAIIRVRWVLLRSISVD